MSALTPSFANVVALLPFETDTLDLKGHTVTGSSGPATLSAAQAPFGTNSLLLESTNNLILDCPRNYAGDFSEEFWWYPTTASGTQVLLDNRGAAGNGSCFTFASNILTFSFNKTTTINGLQNLIRINQWNKIIVSRYGSYIGFFVNGEGYAGSGFTGLVKSDKTAIALNYNQLAAPTNYASGYLKDIRFVSGETPYHVVNYASTPKINRFALPQS